LDRAEPAGLNRASPTRVHALRPESNRGPRGFGANYFPNNLNCYLLISNQ
jgi:hypothetical protein